LTITGRFKLHEATVTIFGKSSNIIGAGELRTYKVRQFVFEVFQAALPIFLTLRLVSFFALTIKAVRQRKFSVLRGCVLRSG